MKSFSPPKSLHKISLFRHYCNLSHNETLCRPNAVTKLDPFALVRLIGDSGDRRSVFSTQQIHCYVCKSGLRTNVFVLTSLLSSYAKLGHLECAQKLFDEIPHPNIVSWNSLISGYVQSKEYLKAIGLMLELRWSSLQPDMFSFTAALTACAFLSLPSLGRSLHCEIVVLGFENAILGNCLINMYGRCGFMDDSVLAFTEMEQKDVISWNSVIGACARNQRIGVAVDLLLQMPEPDIVSYNGILSSIAQFGDVEDAKRILFQMENSNSSSWNSVIAGYIKHNRAEEAVDFFREMHWHDVAKDQFTFSSILKGISCLSRLRWGDLVHCCTIKSGFDSCTIVGSALIDMYSKCGEVESAERIFCFLQRRNLVSWNAMLSGYAHNGKAKEAIRLFERLRAERGLSPDQITFLSVLSACAQDSEFWQDGVRCFESMIDEYKLFPSPEICSSMIELLGKLGEIGKAEKMIYDLGFESCELVWRALLGACKASGALEIADIAAEKVIELEGEDDFVCVLLSNVYACKGKWTHVGEIRRRMRERGARKRAGSSWVEVQNFFPQQQITD